MCLFSKYKDIFGLPSQGVHAYKFLNTAIVDYILTIILAIVVSTVTSFPLVLSTISMFVLGIIMHVLFDIETNTIKYLNLHSIFCK